MRREHTTGQSYLIRVWLNMQKKTGRSSGCISGMNYVLQSGGPTSCVGTDEWRLSPNCRHSGLTYSSAMRLTCLLQAVLTLAALAACGSTPTTLSPCWRAADLQQRERFRGAVLIFAGYDQRPMIFPVACDGGVTVDLPDGVVLPGYGGADLSVPPERLFYEAQVDGEVEGTAFGRPSVRLDHVGEPRQMVPRWLRRNVR